MSKAFVVITYSRWIVEELREAVEAVGGFDFYYSYGWDLPEKLLGYDSVSWWTPGEYAARAQKVGLATTLSSPGPEWLPGVPEAFTGRTTTLSTVSRVLAEPPEVPVFIKPADVKLDFAPAQVVMPEELASTLSDWDPRTIVHCTDLICDYTQEYRFYVVDGDIMTGSVYLNQGRTVYDGASADSYAEAFLFASQLLECGSCPPGPRSYTLDVGFDQISGRWLVIEVNPTWSSGFYNSDLREVVHAIEAACHPIDNSAFLWRPDPYLLDKVAHQVDLRLI